MRFVKSLILVLSLIYLTGCREDIVDSSENLNTGKLYINSVPRGAEIFLDNNRVGKITPDSLLFMMPGNYSVKLRLTGYAEINQNVTIVAGQKRFVNVIFRN